MEQQPSKRQPPACPLQQQQQQQPQPGAAPDEGAGEDPSRIWLPEVVHHVASFLSSNERACTLRLVSKATAAPFRGPPYTAVRLLLLAPHHAFLQRWGSPGATRSLTVQQRAQLPRLTARSGSISNLEVLLARGDLTSPLDPAVLAVAASAGQLEVCRWLRLQGCPLTYNALDAAAKSGHTEVCAWLLAEGCPRSDSALQWAAIGGHQAVCEGLLASGYSVDMAAAPAAAHSGHVGLMDWLLARTTPQIFYIPGLLQSAATGCDLPALQRLHQSKLVRWGTVLSIAERELILGAAAGSPTADWRDKVEWLEGRGFPRAGPSGWAAAQLLDGRERLEWLQRRGYPLTADAAGAAAQHGNADALEFLLGQGVQLDAVAARSAMISAAARGHLAILKVLHAHSYGPCMDHTIVAAAASSGHLSVVAWLVEVLGGAVTLTTEVFASAAGSGSAELLAWLREQGCPWDASVVAAAAGSGSEEQLERLVEGGCPMGDDGEPYRRALANADLAMLRCLRRLGCPWGPVGRMFNAAVDACCKPVGSPFSVRNTQRLLVLPWLLEQGCPIDWAAAAEVVGRYTDSAVVAWVNEHRPGGA